MTSSVGLAASPSRVFIERKTDVTGRWDPNYYLPDVVALEKRVKRVTDYRLRDFVLRMAGGATPSTTEAEKHYTENSDGVPFIRVQNLSTTGRLSLGDCKHITRSTHETLLRRSQLHGGELLVKITGVGRMAIASVVPEKFEGNINQHIVAIQTKDIATSEALAAYLNLDMAERLASRRSTGGTRPALDYPALLSIPIVYDKRIPKLMTAAVERQQKRMNEAEALLATSDDVLLDELGISRQPEPPSTLESRIFHRSFSDLTGGRIDPIANQEKRRLLVQAIQQSRFSVVPFRKLVRASKAIVNSIADGENYIGLENIDGESGEFIGTSERESVGTAVRFEAGQILFPKLRPYLNKTHLATFGGICSTEFHVFISQGVKAEYLTAFLRSKAIVGITSLLMTGNTLPRLQIGDIEALPIPVPPSPIQEAVCDRISAIRAKAFSLREQALADMNRAKRDIEALILGEESGQ